MVCWNKYLVPKNPFIKLKAINTALKKKTFLGCKNENK